MGSCALTRVPPAGELQQDGRLTVTELAGVGLSLSPCHRRLRTLQQSGAISGYHAHLDASGTPTILGNDLVPDAVPRRYIQGASEA
jgi:DNA-binding Lrp family transcriptional regulator